MSDDPLYGHTQTGETPPPPGPAYPWPAEKFGMNNDDLFGKLASLFNTCRIPIRCDASFAADVQWASREASTAQELYDMLARRKALLLQRLEEDLDESRLNFSERRGRDLSLAQFNTLINLLQSPTMKDVLDVVWASQLAQDGSGDDMWTAKMRDRSWGVEPRAPPTCDRVESLPPSPSADPAEPTPVAKALPSTPLPSLSKPQGSPPECPLGAPQPQLASPTRPTIDGEASSSLSTTPAPAHCPAPASSPSLPQASSKTTTASGASPAIPNSLHPETPERPHETPEHTSYGKYAMPPQPLSRKRSREDARGDDLADSPQQQKRAKGE